MLIMMMAMIVWAAAMWYLARFVLRSTARPATRRPLPCHRRQSEVVLPEFRDGVDPGEAVEADLVLARLTGQVDVTTYQQGMAALAASSPSPPAPGARPRGR